MQRMDAHGPETDHADGDLNRRAGEADARPLPPLQMASRNERGVAGEEVERDLGTGTGGPGRQRMAEFVQQREPGDESGQPQTRTAVR